MAEIWCSRDERSDALDVIQQHIANSEATGFALARSWIVAGVGVVGALKPASFDPDAAV